MVDGWFIGGFIAIVVHWWFTGGSLVVKNGYGNDYCATGVTTGRGFAACGNC